MAQKHLVYEKIKSDPYVNSLGVIINQIKPGYAEVSLTVTPNMLNFHGLTHGGVIFSLGDIAFSAASNSHGQTALGMNMNINFIRPAHAGDELIAIATEVNMGGRTALYDIIVKLNPSGDIIAKSQGLVYRKKEPFV